MSSDSKPANRGHCFKISGNIHLFYSFFSGFFKKIDEKSESLHSFFSEEEQYFSKDYNELTISGHKISP
jgi:hypothetical protein